MVWLDPCFNGSNLSDISHHRSSVKLSFLLEVSFRLDPLDGRGTSNHFLQSSINVCLSPGCDIMMYF